MLYELSRLMEEQYSQRWRQGQWAPNSNRIHLLNADTSESFCVTFVADDPCRWVKIVETNKPIPEYFKNILVPVVS